MSRVFSLAFLLASAFALQQTLQAQGPQPFTYSTSTPEVQPLSTDSSAGSVGQAEAASQGSMKPFSHVGVAVELGFLGIGGQIAVPLHARGNLRVAGDAFQYSYLFTTDGFNINSKLNLSSVRLAYDFLPFKGSFHISPTLMLYNGNNFGGAVTVASGTSVQINNVTYTSSASDPLRGNPTFSYSNKVAPGLTIGFGNLVPRQSNHHWSVPFEFGGVYTSQPKALLNLSGTACDQNGLNCQQVATSSSIQANIVAQQNTYQSDYSWLRFYPILQVGVGYKF
jgi:hypothetical protein